LIGYDRFKHRKGSKIHVCVDEDFAPLNFTIGTRNEHYSKRLMELMEYLEKKPKELYADSAYDIESVKKGLRSMNVEANIPVNPRNSRKSKPYDIRIYKKMRGAVERFFG
jgi:hypothetical protein